MKATRQIEADRISSPWIDMKVSESEVDGVFIDTFGNPACLR